MLCEVHVTDSFAALWATLFVLGFATIMALSGSVFYCWYAKRNVTFEKWQQKSNPNYPSPNKVRQEIWQCTKGLLVASFCPALAIFLTQSGGPISNVGKAYCGVHPKYGYPYEVMNFFIVWLASDLFEFAYHTLGHSSTVMWQFHRFHHKFPNPSPFAVIADEFIDQFARSSPLLVFPLLWPINIDFMFAQWAIMFYGYGVFLHWGYESRTIDAHNPILNTAYQHYAHHAKSIMNKPYYDGFFFKLWDNLWGSTIKGPCFCAKCEREAGRRTYAQWKKIRETIPNYGVLLEPKFWSSWFLGNDQTPTRKAAA